jgi:hypothetical protein
VLKLLLDHNLDVAPFDVHELDKTVTYVALRTWRPDFVEVSTPDWIIHLQAAHEGFDGIVSSDWHQLVQDEEVIALDQTRLSVITWRKSLDDPVQQWGSLLAYMPQIRARIQAEGPSVITLPVPTLEPKTNVEPMRGISNRYATGRRDIPRATMVKEALPEMIELLEARGLGHLAPILKGPRPRRTKAEVARANASAAKQKRP